MTMTMTLDPKALTVALLQGGVSAEREVSLASGENCRTALEAAGFAVRTYDTADLSFMDALRLNPPDVAFIALHGRGGEDGTIQGLLELLGIPYIGSGVLTSALAMDKVATKVLYAQTGLPTPEDVVVTRADIAAISEESIQELCGYLVARLGETVVVKPNGEGSSVGVSIVRDCATTLPTALSEALKFDETILVERYIPGLEIMAGVLGNANEDAFALPLIEVETAISDFYDFESKYAPEGSRHILPARLNDETTRLCQELAVAAHDTLGCCGFSRSDIRVAPDGNAYLLETNTIPGMTKTSLIPEAARHIGIEFPDLVTRLIHYALQK